MPELLRTVFFSESQIQTAVEQISHSAIAWLKDKQAKRLNLISILEGAKPLTRDMTACFRKRSPEIEVKIHEIRVKGTEGTRLLQEREWQKGQLDSAVMGPVLLVDDLVDSGLTLRNLKSELAALGGEVRTAVLIRKFGAASGPVDFCGFDLNLNHQALAQKGFKDCWLLGYGMDLNGQYRDLKQIEGIHIPLDA